MVEIQISGLEAVGARLQRLASVRPAAALPVIGEGLVEKTKQSFDNQADPYREKWAPLAARTLSRRAGGTILEDTGALKNSIYWRILGGDAVSVFANQMYGAFHHYGTKRMPRRAFFPWKDSGQGPALPESWTREIRGSLEALYE